MAGIYPSLNEPIAHYLTIRSEPTAKTSFSTVFPLKTMELGKPACVVLNDGVVYDLDMTLHARGKVGGITNTG